MANLSQKSRKAQVLRHLRDHIDQWVDGPELASAQVGGSEGLKRVRELRAEGHRILTRPHPGYGRDIFQYKLVSPDSIPPVVQDRLFEVSLVKNPPHPDWTVKHVPALTEPEKPPQPLTPAGQPFLMRRGEDGSFELTKEVCVDCGVPYDDDLEHRTTSAAHLRWVQKQQPTARDSMDGPDQQLEQTVIGVPEQPAPYKFNVRPTKIDMGTTMLCPRCGGVRRRERKSRKRGQEGVIEPAEDFTRDPFKPSVKGEPNLCPRCGGFGVVPVHLDKQGDEHAP